VHVGAISARQSGTEASAAPQRQQAIVNTSDRCQCLCRFATNSTPLVAACWHRGAPCSWHAMRGAHMRRCCIATQCARRRPLLAFCGECCMGVLPVSWTANASMPRRTCWHCSEHLGLCRTLGDVLAQTQVEKKPVRFDIRLSVVYSPDLHMWLQPVGARPHSASLMTVSLCRRSTSGACWRQQHMQQQSWAPLDTAGTQDWMFLQGDTSCPARWALWLPR
jgi:hypothetical protein